MKKDIDPLKFQIGKNIKMLRNMAGLTLDQVVKSTGICRTSLVHYEQCRHLIPLDRLTILAKALDCSISDIFSDLSPITTGKYKGSYVTLKRLLVELQETLDEAKSDIHALIIARRKMVTTMTEANILMNRIDRIRPNFKGKSRK